MKHEGKKVFVTRVIYNVTRNVMMLIQLRKPLFQCANNWPDILKKLEEYIPKLKARRILWEFPLGNWIKYNTDRASRGNPGISSFGFCLRNHKSDIVYTACRTIEAISNIVVEARAILEASKHYQANNYNHVIIQTDSMLLWKILTDS